MSLLSVQMEHIALLFLDFQVDVCTDGGKLMRSTPKTIERFEQVRKRAASVLSCCRDHVGQIAYAHVGRSIDYRHTKTEGLKQNRLEEYIFQHRAFCKDSIGVSFVEELSPTEGEQVFWKEGMSAFVGSSLASWLTRRGIDTIVLSGVVSHLSVLSTAFDAVDRGFRVFILEDCCTSRDTKRHEAAMELLSPITEITDSQAFCQLFDQCEPTLQEGASSLGSEVDWEALNFSDVNAYAKELVALLAKKAEVADEQLIRCIEGISESLAMRTNAEMAAFYLFSAAIPMCYYRPHLVTELFPLAMYGLLTMYYDRFEDQLKWLRKQIRQTEPFDGLEPEMIGWLRGLIEEESYLHRCFQIAVWWEHSYSDEEEIAGLLYIPDFLKPSEEKKLLKSIDRLPWSDGRKRRMQHYGYQYDDKARSIDKSMFLGSLPDWGQKLAKDFYSRGLLLNIPDQLIVDEYLPGQGMASRIDSPSCFDDMIALLSLGSSCVMEFRHIERGAKVKKWVSPRSLMILSGEARYKWKHAIPNRKVDQAQGQNIERQRRVSLTFRKVILS